MLPALVTPLHRDGAVDEAAMQRLVEHTGRRRFTACLPWARQARSRRSTSGTPQVLAAVVKAAAGRVPVICGVAQSQLAAARADVSAAADLGAVAVLVAPPYYYPIDQPTVLNFYRGTGGEQPSADHGLQHSQNTRVVVEPGTVVRSRAKARWWGSGFQPRLRVLRDCLMSPLEVCPTSASSRAATRCCSPHWRWAVRAPSVGARTSRQAGW